MSLPARERLDAKGNLPGFGEPHTFVQRFRQSADLQADPRARAVYESLIANASVCSYCGVGCPYSVAESAAGKTRVVPMSDLGLCVKGETSLLTGDDNERKERLRRRGIEDDRLRAPMIRGHDGKMKEVSWSEALDRAAWLFLHTREWVGAGAVAIYGNGQKTLEAIWMASLYKLVFKVATIGANSEHCLASAGGAHELNFGNEAAFTWQGFEELELCDVAVLHGTNPYVTFPQAYEKLKRHERAVKVVIDPVRSDTVIDLEACDPKTLHIRFEQGGDAVFNLAVARVILDAGWEDAEYLKQAVDPESEAAFRALVGEDRFTPEAVADRICLEGQDPAELAATIRRYAALLAEPLENGERPRAAFVSSMGINQSTGSYGFSTNLNLLLLTGNVGRRGAGSLRIAGQSNATSELMMGLNARRLVFNLSPGNPEHRQRLAEALEIPEHNIPDGAGTSVARMADDDFLYCFIFIGTQLTRNMPRLGHWRKRLGRAFNIVIDPFLADGVLDHADVLLPSLTYTERTGVIQRGDRTLQLQQGISEAPELAWSDEKILVHLGLAIARRLEDPDTAAINQLDPDAVRKAFGRYVEDDAGPGEVPAAGVFDHLVEVNRKLDLYNRLEDSDGRPVSHALIRESAGRGVQWQGDGRYTDARSKGGVFPNIEATEARKARLVKPPEELLGTLVHKGETRFRSLISGRGRPGRRGRYYRGRYNSGIKTLPITGLEKDSYHVEMHPAYAEAEGFAQGQAVRIVSHHATVFAHVSLNEHVPPQFPFVDFVPGEVNRLTDYIEADKLTTQSFIKRTPVRIEALSTNEAALWEAPDAEALDAVVERVYAQLRAAYPTDEDWERYERAVTYEKDLEEEGAVDWLPLDRLYNPQTEAEQAISRDISALAAFLQQYASNREYKAAAKGVLGALKGDARERFLAISLPLLRKLDYHDQHNYLLADVVGPVRLRRPSGEVFEVDLMAAHKAAVLELKEEVVAVQLYVAIKRGLELLFGEGAIIDQEKLSFVSGIAIPCAGDVPAHIMGIEPMALTPDRLIHCRAISRYAVMMVNTETNTAVKVDIVTGVLPKDSELLTLRGAVITRKRKASRLQHRRFFDRLGELINLYVRRGDDNYALYGPLHLPWEEFRQKMAFVPARPAAFTNYIKCAGLSKPLAEALIALDVVDAKKDPFTAAALLDGTLHKDDNLVPVNQDTLGALLSHEGMSTQEKLEEVISTYVAPVLENDGGRLEYLGYDSGTGVVNVRFVGSCANCPYSMLSMETLVKPALLSVPGVSQVRHRGKLKSGEVKRAAAGEVVS